jgi:hypothetical protein
LIEEACKEPEKRMRKTVSNVCEILHLRWSSEFPIDHPYQARLDGQIFTGNKRLAVVELEAKKDKQIRGALLDLLTHPEPNKVLVLGRSAVCDPPRAAANVRKVLKLLSGLIGQPAVEVFTEDELRRNPDLLGQFLEL